MNGFWKQLLPALRTLGGGRARQDGRPPARAPSPDRPALSPSLAANLEALQERLGRPPDLVVRTLGPRGLPPLAAVYLDGIVNEEAVRRDLIRPILAGAPALARRRLPAAELLRSLEREVLSVSELYRVSDLKSAAESLFQGVVLLLVEGARVALACDLVGWAKRSLTEPEQETGVRVPREGFIEDLQTNLTLLRRRLRSPNLRTEMFVLGRESRTRVVMVWMENLARPPLVAEVRRRLQDIRVDAVLESGYIEEWIEDAPWSPFPQTFRTERPDVVAANLLEGRVALVTDNTPFVLVLPVVLSQFLNTAEDYYERFPIASAIRLLRWGAFLASIVLPAVYVAVTTFHHEMLPTDLILSIAAAREGVPFPAIVEAALMEVLFELLREAGLRLPRVVGPAVTIVGGLILGQAAIQARLVSPALLIVVAITGIASFATPAFNVAIGARLIRFAFLAAAGVFGLYGIMLGLLILVAHLVSLRSFGVPYLAPLTPLHLQDLKDVFFRAPRWAMVWRPAFMESRDPRRIAREAR